MKKNLLYALLFCAVFCSVSCIVLPAPAPAAPDPDRILMSQISQLSEGQPQENVNKVVTRKPSMVDEDQWYYYFQKERREPGYPDYKWTGYLIEFSGGNISNIEKLWRQK